MLADLSIRMEGVRQSNCSAQHLDNSSARQAATVSDRRPLVQMVSGTRRGGLATVA